MIITEQRCYKRKLGRKQLLGADSVHSGVPEELRDEHSHQLQCPFQTASVPKEINVPNGLWRTAGSNTAVSLKFPKGKLGAVFRAKKANRGINTLARAIIALVKEVRLH